MIREKVRKILNNNATRKSAKMTATALSLAIATSSMVACGQDTAAKANSINNKENIVENVAPSTDNTKVENKVENGKKEAQSSASIEKSNDTCNKENEKCNKEIVDNKLSNNNQIKGKNCSTPQEKNCGTSQAKNCNTSQSKNCNTKQVNNCSVSQGNSCDKIKVCNVNSMLNIRKSPTSKSDVIGTLNNNNVVETLGCYNGWCKIKVGDTVGFCSTKYVKPCNGSVSINFKKKKNPDQCTGSDCGIKKDIQQNNKQEEKSLKPSLKEYTGPNCNVNKDGEKKAKEETLSKNIVKPKEDKKSPVRQSNNPPTISAEDATINVGSTWYSQLHNVNANDNEDGNITGKVEVVENKVNTQVPGTYRVTFRVSDSKGETASTTVNVTVRGTANETVNSKMGEGNKENSNAQKQSVDAYSQHFAYVLNQEMYRLVNNHRKNNGLKALDILPNAQELSNIKSKDMAVNNYFDHRDPNGKYNWEKNTQFGPMNGENIVMKSLNTRKQFSDDEIKQVANDLFEMWKHSPGHNRNMLNNSFTGFGFGAYVTKDGRIYGTQTFKI